MQNFFTSHFHQVSKGSFPFLVLNVSLPWGIGELKALLRFSGGENVNQIKSMLCQVIPDHGNRQKRQTLFKTYLFEFE